MFELFRRVKTIVSSEMNHMLDKAEDPVKMLDQYIREMEKDIRDVEKATAKMIAEEKLLKKKADETRELVAKREEQAVKALESGKEDLARRALEDKARVSKDLEQLESLYQDTAQNAKELQLKLKEMRAEFREMETKRDALKTRAGAAKAKSKMNHALSSISGDGSKKGFERMEKKVLQYEAEAEASEEMRSSDLNLDDELKQMDQTDEIDLELQKLKAKMEERNQSDQTKE